MIIFCHLNYYSISLLQCYCLRLPIDAGLHCARKKWIVCEIDTAR